MAIDWGTMWEPKQQKALGRDWDMATPEALAAYQLPFQLGIEGASATPHWSTGIVGDDAFYRALGYSGDIGAPWNSLEGGQPTRSAALDQWLADQGYTLGATKGDKASNNFFTGTGSPNLYQYFDREGNPVGNTASVDGESWLTLMTPVIMAATAGLLGPGAGAAGDVGAGIGGAGAGAAETGIGLLGSTAPEVAALGAGWSPSALGLTEMGALTLPELGLGAAGAGLGAAGGAVGGAAGGAASGGVMNTLAPQIITGKATGAVGGSLLPGLIGGGAALGAATLPGGVPAMENLPQAEYSNEGKNYSGETGLDPVGNSPTYTRPDTPFIDLNGGGMGDWLESAGGSVLDSLKDPRTWASLLGGVAGAAGAGDTTQSAQRLMDPRMQAYLYGSGPSDPKSVFGAGFNAWQANPGGLNPTMQQGLDMQRAALTDPAYGQGYQSMRSLGQGLLGGQTAANPFTSGLLSLTGAQTPPPQAQAGGAGGLIGDSARDRARALMASGRGLIG